MESDKTPNGMTMAQRIRLAWRVLTRRPGGLMRHAEQELGPSMDIELRELVHVFASQGHSGASAAITADLLGKLLRYEPIGPLTGEPTEWMEVGPGVYQNKRCGRVFKDESRFGGQAYDVNGIVWIDPDGDAFTNSDSCAPVTFPYTPKTERKHRPTTSTTTNATT